MDGKVWTQVQNHWQTSKSNGIKKLLWNGPLGVFEMESFANGTIELANNIAASTAKKELSCGWW
jgi:3-phosphoglycerate kinase